ncbi:protein DpdF [Paraburkholderia terrae]|uniref:protein DpdF n=1 Tax=Paraburkholderia terrae TaxID=311230 RepID=UPI001EE36029|nr:protein DpdF [Paraburkholderia terrae]GJG99179.1 ATP-dependent DNA helicase RecQ [Paraburkholderia terrae]
MKRDLFGDAELREYLADWERAGEVLGAPGANDLLERLRQVLQQYTGEQPLASHTDFIALIRQWLLWQAANAGATWLKVPSTPQWPDQWVWREAGFDVSCSPDQLEIKARKPRLVWLGKQSDLFDDVFDRLQALAPKRVAAEAFVADLLNVDSFTGEGQREAVRSLIHMPADITLIAALPTGNGKSLLAQLPALMHDEGYLTLAIVPTVALAIDQARRIFELLRRKHPDLEHDQYAYHSGLSTEERASVFRAVRNGSQRILFTSPEAATGSLRKLLEECATAGSLTHVVIDEAHLVAAWGSGFRPSFQLLPALITRLRSMAPHPIRVALASATLTPHTVTVLKQQFGPPEKTQLISGVYLRPEPRYAAALCASEQDKQARVIDALRTAPRPFILYVTRPDEARTWLNLLRLEGFSRVAAFTGQTRAAERRSLLLQWTRNEIDGMIATSAFGLGVDKGDVRTVIHATFPESLDRFYQEVGRSGRDGIAAASLLLYTKQDAKQAYRMAHSQFIGNELGFERWTSMIGSATPANASDGNDWIDLNQLRPKLMSRGKANLAWNLRTLNLMVCSGLIELTALSANRPDAAHQQQDDLGESDLTIGYAAVRLRNPDHGERKAFARSMQAARLESKDATRRGFELMLDIARNVRPVDDALCDLYQKVSPVVYAPVRAYCGGCASHWSDRSRDPVEPAPFVGRLDRFAFRTYFEQVLRVFPRVQPNLAFVVVDDVMRLLEQSNGGLLDALLSRMRPHTVAMAHETQAAHGKTMRARLGRLRSDAFIDTFDAAAPDSLTGGKDEVRIIVWISDVISQSMDMLLRTSPCAMTVMIVPRTLRDPQRPDRTWPGVLPHLDEATALQVLKV